MKAASSSGSGGGVSGLLPSKALGIILVLQTLVILHVVYILHHPRIFLKEILIREIASKSSDVSFGLQQDEKEKHFDSANSDLRSKSVDKETQLQHYEVLANTLEKVPDIVEPTVVKKLSDFSAYKHQKNTLQQQRALKEEQKQVAKQLEVAKPATQKDYPVEFYGNYKTHRFSIVAQNWTSLIRMRQVCMASHSSLERLNWLVNTVRAWSGPISIALYVTKALEEKTMVYIRFLRRCYPAIRKQVTFHFTYSALRKLVYLDHPPDTQPEWAHLFISPCSNFSPTTVLDNLIGVAATSDEEANTSLDPDYYYPQNNLRNIALSGCWTNYTFSLDIDMIPYPDLDMELETFLYQDSTANSCDKCAFVVPGYELSSSLQEAPKNKTELMKLVKAKTARSYHSQSWNVSQGSSNLRLWESLPQSSVLGVSHNISRYFWQYEPIYVAKKIKELPKFDERFRGYGGTRSSQIYEMIMACYHFQVLNNAFTVHWNFKAPKSPTLKARRTQQTMDNEAKFETFFRETREKYKDNKCVYLPTP